MPEKSKDNFDDTCRYRKKKSILTVCKKCGYRGENTTFRFNHGDCPFCGMNGEAQDGDVSQHCPECGLIVAKTDLYCERCGYVRLRANFFGFFGIFCIGLFLVLALIIRVLY